MRDRRNRRGCLGPLFLFILGAALGLAYGVIIPERGRNWVISLIWFASGPTPSASPKPPPPTPTATPVNTPPPLAASPTPTPTPAETALPVIPPKTREVARLYNGIQVRTALDTEPGQPASFERETPASYALDLHLQVKVPAPMRTLAELSRHAPALGTVLPKLPALIEKSEVSKFFNAIYQNKTDLLRQNLTRLDALLGRDVFFDTDTVLELQDPDSHRKLLLIQSDMDVDTDGSDPERWDDIDTSDPNFQPLTNYRWLKRDPAVINPLALIYQDRIGKLETEAKTPAGARNKTLTAALEKLRDDLYGVEHYSSLIARNDPYVVLPAFMARPGGKEGFGPQVGDYVVVIAGGKLYPAIFGDKGPNHLLGEASLRLAQAVDPRATANRSPVDDLKITYLVFPGTAEQPFGPPDLGKIRERCQQLLDEIGGNKAELYEWASLLPAPMPTPTPTPTPSPPASPSPAVSSAPTPVVSPTPSPTASASPAPNPTPTPTPSATPSAGPTPAPTPTPTPTPAKSSKPSRR